MAPLCTTKTRDEQGATAAAIGFAEAIRYPVSDDGAIPYRNPSCFSALAVQVARVPTPTAASGDGRHDAPTTRAEIERLFRHTGITTLAGVVVALCTWLLFHRHRPSMPVLAWALLIHGAQATTLGVLLAFRRDTDALTPSRRRGGSAIGSRWR